MEKFRCKLCFKQFVNGKALGGHMRSHLAVLPLPPKTPPQKQDSMDAAAGRSDSTLSLCSEEVEEEQEEETPRKSVRLVDPDRESESESTRNPTRRRSKRARRMFFGEAEEEVEEKGKAKLSESSESAAAAALSSFSDEEEIARCLMMLSQDVWRASKSGEKFQCEICSRQFKSSQALGSHRTTHNRGEIEHKPRNPGAKIEDQKMHECPFCGKVFGSGQALGGHKRSHLSHSSTPKTPASCSSKVMIDLNLPAPMEDEEDEEEEEAEVSAVSDAEPVEGR